MPEPTETRRSPWTPLEWEKAYDLAGGNAARQAEYRHRRFQEPLAAGDSEFDAPEPV